MPTTETDRIETLLSSRARGMRSSAIREILKVTSMPDVISFAGGLPAPELFPVADLRRAAEAVLDQAGPASLQYDISEGHPPLRQWLSAHLGETVGLAAPPDRILITNGSQQGLDLVAKILLDPGDLVLTENPAYIGALQAFQAYEANVRGLPVDNEGIRIDALRDFLTDSPQRPKLLYLVPNFQNPTGTSTSERRRREVAAVAAEFGLLIVEDDPYGRLRYLGRHLPSLTTLPGVASWVYLGTASKILSPGMRLGWIATSHASLYERLILAKQAADMHTSAFTQRVAFEFVRQPGALDAHVDRLRAAYARRRDAMLAALGRHLPEGCTWTQPGGGLFLWVRLPDPIDTAELLQACIPQKIAFVPGASFWVGREVRNTLRLNFSNASEERIADGIARLGRAIYERFNIEPGVTPRG